mmetsp:Transcript_64435/g.114597  ORF Transcript_64435/g.114597 Transcript_64435/m.114597 type:complete len:806 (-) Transcript_64435:65-2482(-)
MGKTEKPVNCTVAELEAAKTELKALIAKLNKSKADKEEVQPPADKVQNNLELLIDVVKKNAGVAEEAVANARTEAKDHSDELYNNVRDEVLPMFPQYEKERVEADQELEAQIHQLDTDVRESFAQELTSLCEKIDAEFATLRKDMTDLVELRAKEAAEASMSFRNELDLALKEFKKEAAARDVETRSIAVEDLRKAVEEEKEEDARIHATAKKDREEVEEKLANTNAVLEELRDYAQKDAQRSRDEATAALNEFKDESHDTFGKVFGRADEHQDFLEQLDQMACRRVEWLLPDFSKMLQRGILPEKKELRDADGMESPTSSIGGGLAKYMSFFSPKFHASGGRNLQLELRVAVRPGTHIPLDKGSDSCGLYLWCHKGLQLHLRFFAGEKWVTVEKGHHSEGCVGAKRIANLQDIIGEDGNLQAGIEVLESIREFSSEASISPLTSGGTGDANKEAQDERAREQTEGTLVFHRHMNHRVLPQVRKEVEKIQNKLVRRVEWKIQEADQLKRVFPHGTPICSPVFQAAGVEGLQFIFYPQGYMDSTENFCSLFIYCPAGVNMKCNLLGGNQKRDVSNHFVEAAAHGRVNFCRLDSVIDADTNSATICLEIEELSQETMKSINEKGSKPSKSKKPQMLELESASPVPPIGSEVKLVRIADRSSLSEVNKLPSMWTYQALGDFVKKPDGYRDMKELPQAQTAPQIPPNPRASSQPPAPAPPIPGGGRGPAGAASTAPPGHGFGAGGRSESSPVLRSPSLDAATSGGENSLPLISGPQNEWGSEQGHGSPLLWAGKSRKARTATNFRPPRG